MSHMGNWSADKKRRVAGEMEYEARLRSADSLKALGLTAWATCRACCYTAAVNLDALISSGQGHKDVWLGVKHRCSRCGDRFPEVVVEWMPGLRGISPPRGWG